MTWNNITSKQLSAQRDAQISHTTDKQRAKDKLSLKADVSLHSEEVNLDNYYRRPAESEEQADR